MSFIICLKKSNARYVYVSSIVYEVIQNTLNKEVFLRSDFFTYVYVSSIVYEVIQNTLNKQVFLRSDFLPGTILIKI